MDSVSQKQNYLSLTGIDQLQEATDNIEELQKEVNVLQDQINNNVLPNYVTIKGDQTIEGPKSFLQPLTTAQIIATSIRPQRILTGYNSASKIGLPIVFQCEEMVSEKATNYQMTYDPTKGLTAEGTFKTNHVDTASINALGLTNTNTFTANIATIKEKLTAPLIVGPLITATSYVSGDIKIQGGEVTAQKISASNATKNGQIFADIAQINSSLTVTGNCDARMFLLGGTAYTNVTIPFAPSLQRSMTSSPTFTTAAPVAFFQGITSTIAVNNTQFTMSRYKHPFNYWITRISAMFDAPTPAPTANVTHTIAFQFYSGDGATPDVGNVVYNVQFVVTPTMRCATTDFNLYIPFNKSLGAMHVYSAATGIKNVQYVIHGFQAM